MANFKHYSIITGAVAACLASACIPPGDGREPDTDRVYFPVSLSMSQSNRLIVVNSDFDLQFSQGTVQSLSVERIAEVTQQPCNSDQNCTGGELCDAEPSEYNDGAPSYVCVDAEDPRPCGAFGEKTTSSRAISPGRCAPVLLDEPQDGGESLLVDVAQTAAFATQGLLVARPCVDGDDSRTCRPEDGTAARVPSRKGEAYPERLFIPIRGDTTIHYLDLDAEGRFICGRPYEDGDYDDLSNLSDKALRCDSKYRVFRGKTYGADEEGNFVETDAPPLPGDLDDDELAVINDDPTNDFRLQPEPIDLAASADGRVVAVSHQEGGVVSSLMNNWLDPPSLVHILRSLSSHPIGIAAIPRVRQAESSAVDFESTWDFLLSYRKSAQLDLLHFDDGGLLDGALAAGSSEGGAAVETYRPAMDRVDTTVFSTNASGVHSRGVVVDDRGRQAALEACSGDADCEQAAAETAMTVYVANRSPSSLLIGRTGGGSQLARASLMPRFYDSIALSAGPSRVLLGNVIGPSGELLPRVFVICFDAGLIYVFDPERGTVESELRTGRGPHSVAFNYEEGVIYVGHFTDSYIGVISIDQRFPFTYGATLATLGEPEAPRAQK